MVHHSPAAVAVGLDWLVSVVVAEVASAAAAVAAAAYSPMLAVVEADLGAAADLWWSLVAVVVVAVGVVAVDPEPA